MCVDVGVDVDVDVDVDVFFDVFFDVCVGVTGDVDESRKVTTQSSSLQAEPVFVYSVT